jgi:hypothetical protein
VVDSLDVALKKDVMKEEKEIGGGGGGRLHVYHCRIPLLGSVDGAPIPLSFILH